MRTVSEDVFHGHNNRGARTKYKYDEMSDGRPHVLVRGEDFDDDIDNAISVITAIRKGFAQRGFRIRGTVLNDNEVAVQVTGRM